MQLTPGYFIYTVTKFLEFKRIDPSCSSLQLNTHFIGTGFLHLAFTWLILIAIQAILDRKLLISDTDEIFHKLPISVYIYSSRVPSSPISVEIDVLRDHCIYYSSYSAIRMTLVQPLTLHFTSMIGSVPFIIVGLQVVYTF